MAPDRARDYLRGVKRLYAIVLNWVSFAILSAGSAVLAVGLLWSHLPWMEAAETAAISVISALFSIHFYRLKRAQRS